MKPGAFMPDSNKELSVFHTEKFKKTEAKIWQLADDHIPTDSKIGYRADITVEDIEEADLNIDFDNEPPLHANIVGWPEGKDKQKEYAMSLASSSTLIIRT
ncbi:MAG: hypothetical protein K9M57_01855 [Phycisphaerae bacterium]|nr:hypothetical protein [Phycisphaerae bacterium]